MSQGPQQLQEHIKELLSSEWGFFDFLVAEEAYSRPVSIATYSKDDGKWILQPLREMLQAFAPEAFHKFKSFESGEPIRLLPTTSQSWKFTIALSEMSHWEPLVVPAWDDEVCGLWDQCYNARKKFEEVQTQWQELLKAENSVYGSAALKQFAERLERQSMEQRCRKWADQALAIYEDSGFCPSCVDGDSACGASALHVATTLTIVVLPEDKAFVVRKVTEKAAELCAPESTAFET